MFEGVGFVRVAWDAYIVSFESEDKHKRFTMHVLARLHGVAPQA
jgi:hypothetical protein